MERLQISIQRPVHTIFEACAKPFLEPVIDAAAHVKTDADAIAEKGHRPAGDKGNDLAIGSNEMVSAIGSQHAKTAPPFETRRKHGEIAAYTHAFINQSVAAYACGKAACAFIPKGSGISSVMRLQDFPFSRIVRKSRAR